MLIAVVPVTWKLAPVPSVNCDRASRRSRTRSLVASSVGLVEGTASKNAVSPASLNCGGETDTTPSTPATSAAIEVTACFGSAASPASTTIISGPLKPGPKALASSSYARRSVAEVGLDSSPGIPNRSAVAGIASAPSSTTPRVRTAIGRRSTNRAHRVPPRPRDFSPAPTGSRAVRRAERDNTFSGTNPRTAGTRVSATRTATTTATTAASPILVSIGMPTTARPARAMTTVRPANATAEPAVPTASATASTADRPCDRSSR